MPKLNAEWQRTAPKIEPEWNLDIKKKILAMNIPITQITDGTGRKSHSPPMNTSPKCEIWVSANAVLSTTEARFSPIDLAKL